MDKLSLLKQFEENPKQFVNRYMNAKFSAKDSQEAINIDIILVKEFLLFGEKKFSEIFFNIKNNYPAHNCKICSESTKFKSFFDGYKTYCSLKCSRSDSSKTSEESKNIGTAKRKAKMKILLEDPIKGKEYREKISRKAKYNNNLPGAKEQRSKKLKQRIASGEWTPSVTSTYTHWKISVDGKKFRSSFEAIFYLYMHIFKNSSIEYESIRIPYAYYDKQHSYIVDFEDIDLRILYEIKPTSQKQQERNVIKESYARNWCSVNNYTFEVITEVELKNYTSEMIKAKFTHPFLIEFRSKYPSWFENENI